VGRPFILFRKDATGALGCEMSSTSPVSDSVFVSRRSAGSLFDEPRMYVEN